MSTAPPDNRSPADNPRAALAATGRAVADWPPPGPQAVEHSLRLIDYLRAQMAGGGGVLSFQDYMHSVLYAPGLGYYSAGAGKFGASGDFVTAPEISPLFAGCLAHALAPLLRAQPEFVVLEAGAGSGRLAADLLLALQQQGLQPQYRILEVSSDLRQRQQQTLTQCGVQAQVQWLDAWPDALRGIVLANELLDAMPVRRVQKRDGEWREQCVAFCAERLDWSLRDITDPRLRQRLESLEQLHNFPDGYTTEINLAAEAWLASLAEHLRQGVVLVLDYGFARSEFYHPQRSQGTLMCHYRHRAHSDPFVYPGLQDITAHVDFSAMADAAHAAGFDVAGYTTQAHFLLHNGLTEQLAGLDPADEVLYLQRVNEVKRLTLPQEMGEIFKVMWLARDCDMVMDGFAGRDLRHQL